MSQDPPSPRPFFVSAHSKGVTGAFFISAHSKGLISRTLAALGTEAVESSAEFLHHETDDEAADGSQAEDGDSSLRNDRIGQAEKHTDEESHAPARPRQADCTDDESDSETVDEGSEDSCPFVWEAHGKHYDRVHGSEHKPANRT